MVNVVIPESIPSLNKGEMAIFEGIREALSVFPDKKITLYAAWYDIDRARVDKEINVVKGIDFYNMRGLFGEKSAAGLNKIKYLKKWGTLVFFALLARISKKLAYAYKKDDLLLSIANADLLIVGHDGCLNPELFWFVLAANIIGKSVAIYGVGVENNPGFIKSGLMRKFLQYAFAHTIFNAVRDSGSKKYLLANNIPESSFFVFPDPAILMKPSSDERIREILFTEKITSGSPLFGLIPVRGGVVYERSFTEETDIKKKHERRVQLWVKLVLHLIHNTNAHFVFIPHCIGPTPKNDDRIIAGEITQKLIGQSDRFTCITNEYSAKECKGLMKNCDFVLGERTHGLLGAISTATPCMALTVQEDQRMHNIVNIMFKRKTYDLNNPDIIELQKCVLDEWNNRATIKREMEEIAQAAIKEAQKAASMLKERFDKARK